ncbi:NAD(P)/FAD-dependent oxidoreductase [Blastopirellula sp. JC732]|uniref:NADH:ubiquinone reductase (non-electrogenic) n=1 Tax=Blastopirellula sediminis TaxID=2894196 RepID=A0A9X1MSU6_9BACT|nr:NAD(P)/FAD-dependent oxidoreductase [Blastopirellula sediminis]MCC9604925.1 NAD(P)/FAD-dependent oxidoreductase [Blastopirellula sediminis]MCC9631775.1 NAD(P)/FAD-dependent oxidoreductase [Blastopirellula sediminis]
MKGETHRVVIIGGGFGGLYAARSLGSSPVQVTMVDRRNFHLFQPLLYQVATGGLSPANIAAPLRRILVRQRNTEVVMADVADFDPENKKVILHDGEIAYDSLIVAAGAETGYFGQNQWAKLSPGLKSIEDATEIRRRVLSAFEQAERETDPKLREELLTFVIVGGGPTGVELAGALAEISHNTMKYDFRNINPADARILLVDAGERVLAPFPVELSTYAHDALVKLGVEVHNHHKVCNVEEDSVVVSHNDEETTIRAKTIIWAAGVQANPLGRKLAEKTGAKTDRGGRVMTEPDCTIAGHPEIFVIGDMACYAHQGEHPLPGVAPVAMQQGQYAAKTIVKRLQGKPVDPFHYHDPGSLATIGRSKAVAVLGKWKYTGFVAWVLWLVIHLMKLIQFESRLLVLMQWSWAYSTFNRSARLITGEDYRQEELQDILNS